jgi:hypothetical protein
MLRIGRGAGGPEVPPVSRGPYLSCLPASTSSSGQIVLYFWPAVVHSYPIDPRLNCAIAFTP